MTDCSANSVLDANRAAGTRLELLLFRLDQPQLYGINVFKVQEVVGYRPLTRMAGCHPLVKGIATLRGITMSVIDLAQAIGFAPLSEPERGQIVVTEYNRSVHGFLVRRVERIIHTQWDQVQPLPKKLGGETFVTAVTLIDKTLIEILDVEKALDQVVHASTEVSSALTKQTDARAAKALVVDDSSVARHQIQRALEQIGVECTLMNDGKQAIEYIERLLAAGVDVARHFALVISDVEMPEIDGYRLTTWLRQQPGTREIYVLLHSSISGVFNLELVRRTGANQFIQKYHPDDLARAVLERVRQIKG